MQVDASGKIFIDAISDTFELTEIIHRLGEFISDGADPEAARYLARNAMATAEHAAWRIREQSERIAALERDSVTDPLTGLLNLRGFQQELHRALSDARRHDETGALIYIDLDQFKVINDTYGHCAGDAVLKRVASVLHSNVRDADRVARHGGDEFAVIMFRTELADAKHRADLLTWSLNHAAVDWQGSPIPVQASLGTEVFGANDAETTIIERADQAMYRSKQIRAEFPVMLPSLMPAQPVDHQSA